MAHSQPAPGMQSSHSANGIPILPRRIDPNHRSSNPLGIPQSATIHNVMAHGAHFESSNNWTMSGGELGLVSDTDEIEDRALWVEEYNRLAKKVWDGFWI